MCGILGCWGPTELPLFKTALERIEHRGPDGSGLWFDSSLRITLGHKRLSIIDLSESGSQPMHSENFVITFNGEIYNYLELRQILRGKGYQFKTKSDTEVLLHAYSCWGAECLSRLNGMWAFAIWDKRNQTLFLSRDRFGKKPLFYSFQGDSLIFGSEMKAICPLMSEVKVSPDFHWFNQNLFTYESTNRCLINGIFRFPAGSYVLVKQENIKQQHLNIVRFWNTLDNLVDVPTNYNDQVERFRELFVDACSLRMRSDVPIGTALSGGLDSSAVCCTMHNLVRTSGDSHLADDWQRAYVATFPDTNYDERIYAESVVDHVGAQAIYLEVDPIKGLDRLGSYIYQFEELYQTSPVPMMAIYEAVSNDGVKVTIDGHGADELLTGYDNFLRGMDDSLWDREYSKHILTCWGQSNPDLIDVYKQLRRNHKGNKGLIKFLFGRIIRPKFDDFPGKKLGYFNEELYSCFHSGILPTLLRNYDRYSMAAGVEIRMPFMDHRLVSFCFSLPWTSKIPKSSTYTKAILRDAIGSWMPKKVSRRRSKIGFGTPFAYWAKGEWKSFVGDTISSQGFKECGLVNHGQVSALADNVLEGRALNHQADTFWGAIAPYLWKINFLDRV